MADLVEAIDGLTEALRESLKHPKHATTLAPIHADLTKLLVGRFKKQKRALLKESQTWLKWLTEKYSEAAGDLKASIKHAVTVNLEAGATLTSDPSRSDVEEWADGIAAAAEGAGRVISADLGIETALEKSKAYATSYLRDKGFQKLAADIDDTTRERIADAVADVYAGGGSYADAVKAIEDSFDAMTETRANTIATTELADVYNSAMLDSAKEAGDMQKTWNAEGPDPCEECIANEDQGPLDLDEDFQSGDDAPPAHPNAVLAGSSFRSYGRLLRMVAAEYDGPAITLNTGKYRTTIGPNHPMLTTHGLKAAKLLKIGDDLVCDLRPIRSPRAGSESDFDQIVLVEDCFRALRSSFGLSGIAASRHDFHSDAVSDQHEIEVVFSKGKLLSEFDPCGLQRCGELDFSLPDMEAFYETRVGPHTENAERILLAASSGMRRLNVDPATFGHYVLATIKDIRIEHFKGRAFDASTSVGLYCSDGFVVANCLCSVGFVKSEKEE